MTFPDAINGSLEIACSVMLWLDVLALRRHGGVSGVSIWARGFFWAWSIWNLFWYPHLGQWLSTVGAVAVMIPQTLWLYMLCKFELERSRNA